MEQKRVSGAVAEQMEDRPRPGDRVKILGTGEVGVYFTDRPFYEGGEFYPVIRINGDADREKMVMDRDQLRKV